MRDGLLQRPVPLVPAGSLPVQAGRTVRGFQPQLQAQHLGEQGMVAVPAVAERLDERAGPGQRRQGAAGLLITSQLPGQVCAHPVQNAGPQHELPLGGRQRVEHLIDQIAGQSVVLGGQVLNEELRIGMAIQRQGGQS